MTKSNELCYALNIDEVRQQDSKWYLEGNTTLKGCPYPVNILIQKWDKVIRTNSEHLLQKNNAQSPKYLWPV